MNINKKQTSIRSALSSEEVASFHRDGVIGPFTFCAPAEMAGYRERMVKEAIERPPQWKYQGRNADSPYHYRHLDCPVIHQMCSHPSIVDRLASLFGSDLLLWRTSILMKMPGTAEGKRIPWHQDGSYFNLVPEANISFWLAVDPATEENGCVQLLPGTHTTIFPTTESDGDDYFESMSRTDGVDTSRAVKMILRPGQFFIFSERSLHCSEPNRSNSARMCLIGRVVPTIVKIDRPFEREEGVTLLCGEDRMGFNHVVAPPADT